MKKTFDIFQLKFKAPLHLSRGKPNSYESSESVLHSDTLKAAIFATAMDFYGEDFATRSFWDSFQISSAMPFWKDTYYWTRPLHWQPQGNDTRTQKKWKKVTYFSTDDFQHIINGKTLQALPKTPTFYEKIQTQRVFIPLEGDSMPFYLEKIYFADEAGLYFLCDTKGDEKLLDQLHGIIALLGEQGIGTQRNLGNGYFKVKLKTVELTLPDNSNTLMSLSLYCPKKEELESDFDIENSHYLLLKRGGWVSSSQPENMSFRKKSIYMFSEGAVFQCKKEQNNATFDFGKTVNIQPDIMKNAHEVWREGKGFFIPVK